MGSHLYSMPRGVHAIPAEELDLSSDAEVDAILLNPQPPSSSSEKNIWLFWHSGYSTMHAYTQRTVRTYHRRFSKKGWAVRVVDRAPGSPCNVANFLDLHDPATFPQAFRDGTMTGTYALQHTSDLVRWPLLLKYGGVYVDVGLMPIGDLDRLWDATVGDPGSRWEIISNNAGPPDDYDLTNYLLCARSNNPVFQRCHRLLLALWSEDGGKTSTEGMHKSSLLRGLPLLGQSLSDQDSKDLTDYIIQGQVMRMVLSSVDDEDGWDGPEYVTKHIYALEYMVGSQLINEMTAWDGSRAFELMSLKLPRPGETESGDQKLAREIVEACLSRSFSFKLAHGIIIRVLGVTLGSLWRAYPGSDNIIGTYAHWLRYGMLHWSQDELPEPMAFVRIAPIKTGPLLRAD
ncbi:capsule polysaccharide biosynthesis protein [Diaporthe helianthi]|uniref:Capsule polysaccharide biosynthesis protein n=1 Tax=Diaporthe helianthi TaxID=158607 RepID=A0A2P5HEC1_DIAHE|nr:capsule polysaccharide biosynthesis protein [Diaporthe helianthi]